MTKSTCFALAIAGVLFSASIPQATWAAETTAAPHTSAEEFKAINWDLSQRGRPLDLSRFQETFRDDFRKMSITAEDGEGPWYAPVHGPFGAAAFPPPQGANNPFSLVVDGLQIRAEKGPKKWRSGLAQTVNKKGEGFAQQYGYFEMSNRSRPGGVF